MKSHKDLIMFVRKLSTCTRRKIDAETKEKLHYL